MDSIINLQKKIVPELTNLLVQRYQILRQVSHEHPIGRRALAARLGLSERVLRAQVDFLKGCGLLVFFFVRHDGNGGRYGYFAGACRLCAQIAGT